MVLVSLLPPRDGVTSQGNGPTWVMVCRVALRRAGRTGTSLNHRNAESFMDGEGLVVIPKHPLDAVMASAAQLISSRNPTENVPRVRAASHRTIQWKELCYG